MSDPRDPAPGDRFPTEGGSGASGASDETSRTSGTGRPAWRTPVPDRAMWVNGKLARGREAQLSLFDRGARDGEGIFETVRVERGRAQHWRRHLERLVLAAAELGFPVPPSPSALSAALGDVLAANDLSDAVVRITVTRGIPGGRPTRAGCWIEAESLSGRLWRGTRTGQASAMISAVPFSPGPIGRFKTTSRLAYHLAREEARAAGVDEALLCGADGMVFEGAVSNLFAVLRGEVATPPLTSGIVPGITRARVLELCASLGIASRERTLSRDELRAADELFVTNSVQQVVPLVALDGHPVPSRTLGARLREIYRERAAAEG
jgi:branched-subunit amino acid aminotransferase/4-amino-4-deoxychorismate lyase